jgi:hypothetical protein
LGEKPKTVCFTTWSDTVIGKLKAGIVMTVTFDVSSREYNGRWYTDVNVWKCEVDAASVEYPTSPEKPETPEPYGPGVQNTDDELPF